MLTVIFCIIKEKEKLWTWEKWCPLLQCCDKHVECNCGERHHLAKDDLTRSCSSVQLPLGATPEGRCVWSLSCFLFMSRETFHPGQVTKRCAILLWRSFVTGVLVSAHTLLGFSDSPALWLWHSWKTCHRRKVHKLSLSENYVLFFSSESLRLLKDRWWVYKKEWLWSPTGPGEVRLNSVLLS